MSDEPLRPTPPPFVARRQPGEGPFSRYSDPQVTRIALTKMRVSDAVYVRRNLLIEDFPAFERELEHVVIRLESHVMAHRLRTHSEQHLVAEDTWKFPASPWQFFKERHADSWWLGWQVRRWPVKYNVEVKRYEKMVTIGRDATFPECTRDFYPGDFGRPVLVDTVSVFDV